MPKSEKSLNLADYISEKNLPQHYHRYLEKALRKKLGLLGIPILLTFKSDDNPYT